MDGVEMNALLLKREKTVWKLLKMFEKIYNLKFEGNCFKKKSYEHQKKLLCTKKIL